MATKISNNLNLGTIAAMSNPNAASLLSSAIPTDDEIKSRMSKITSQLQQQSSGLNNTSNIESNNIDNYINSTIYPANGDDTSINKETDYKNVQSNGDYDDALIPLINYTDPVVKHDPTFTIEPIVLPYMPEEAHDLNEEGELNTYEIFDHIKVDGIMYPLIRLGNKVLTREQVSKVILKYTGIAPQLELIVYDFNDFTKRSDIFGMNSEITIVIVPPIKNTYKPIRLLFQIVKADFYNDNKIYVIGKYKLGTIKESVIRDITFTECKKCKHPQNNITTTWEFLHEIAIRTGLGFSCTDKCEEINDRNQRFLSGKNYLDYMETETAKGGLDENSLFDVWIDLYNYIVMVNLPYIFNSDITYRHLSIRAVTGLHNTAVGLHKGLDTEHIKTVHRVFTNFDLTAEPSNLLLESFDVIVNNNVVEYGNLSHNIMYIPRGTGSENVKDPEKITPNDDSGSFNTSQLTQALFESIPKKQDINALSTVDVLVAQNSQDGIHLSDYIQTCNPSIMILRDMTNTKLQATLRNAFLNKRRQRVYKVKLSKLNLDVQRGTIIEIRWFEDTPDAKHQAQHSPDNILGQQSVEKEPINYDSLTDREAIVDESFRAINFGNSGQFYVDGMEFIYNEGDEGISQYLYLIKKGITDNLTNKYTAPRMKDDAFDPVKIAPGNVGGTEPNDVMPYPVD